MIARGLKLPSFSLGTAMDGRSRTIRFKYKKEYLDTIEKQTYRDTSWIPSVRDQEFTSIYTPSVGTVYIELTGCHAVWSTEVFEYLGEV